MTYVANPITIVYMRLSWLELTAMSGHRLGDQNEGVGNRR